MCRLLNFGIKISLHLSITRSAKGPFNKYVDKMRGQGVKNSVHVVVECQLMLNYQELKWIISLSPYTKAITKYEGIKTALQMISKYHIKAFHFLAKSCRDCCNRTCVCCDNQYKRSMMFKSCPKIGVPYIPILDIIDFKQFLILGIFWFVY